MTGNGPVQGTSLPSIANLGLESLSREELISVVEQALGGTITITFSGKTNATRIARKVRPRVTRRIKSLSVGDETSQASNLLIEGDNLQAMATLYRERGQVDLILADPPTTRATTSGTTTAGKRIPTIPGWVSSSAPTMGLVTRSGCGSCGPGFR